MDLFKDYSGPPAPSDFELQADFDHRRRLTDKREYREALAEAEHRIERLETALAATIRALAFGETTIPTWDDHLHQHTLAGTKTAEHLAHAAQALGLDLEDLGLAYALDEP